jgi:glycosyltransferase involved in cell wall biosynthesis
MNVVLGRRMAERVAGLGVRGELIRILPNWADGGNIGPVEPAANLLRQEWQLGDAFVVGYSGNLGRAHEIDTLLEAMTILEMGRETDGHAGPTLGSSDGASGTRRNGAGRRQVLWLFIGAGVRLEALKAEVARRRLTSARFKPYQPRARLAESLSAADMHLVSLRPALEGLIVPSKIYGIAAAGRPAIFVGHEDGEIAHLLLRHRCGTTVATGDGGGLARAIAALAADPDLCRQMGRRARQAFEAEFDKPLALARWETLLLGVSGRVQR